MRETVKSVYFISGSIIPLADAGGGSVVIYRHLKRLEAQGYSVVIINCNNNIKTVSEFSQINIKKKLWHPPLRKFTPFLSTLRFKMYYRYLDSLLSFKPEDKIISILEDQGSLLSYVISKKTKTPYYLFFHDDNVFSVYFKSHILHKTHLRKIISDCTHFFVVSESMKQLIINNGSNAVTVLYPIPDGHDVSKKISDVNFDDLKFCYSGMLMTVHYKLIDSLHQCIQKNGVKLVLISNFDENTKLKFTPYKKLEIIYKIEKLQDLFSYFIKKIDVLVIFYSFDMVEEVRALHSFPSKFIEYCHLGIPILIIAPVESAFGTWAKENEWLSYVCNDNPEEISNMINNFKDELFWIKCQNQCLEYAKTEFNPQKIHSKFSNILNG